MGRKKVFAGNNGMTFPEVNGREAWVFGTSKSLAGLCLLNKDGVLYRILSQS